ncbi:MAG: hypothetical protein ACO3SO_01255 [Luteolibacter sp.]
MQVAPNQTSLSGDEISASKMAVSLLACFLITTAGVACAQGDLEKARALFPAFSKAVYTDEDKAEEIYQTLAALLPVVPLRMTQPLR